jgi:hypothetical protein
MKKSFLFPIIIVGITLTFVRKVSAVCPICTVAVGAGVGLSRWLGIDDSITGLWVGGLIVSMITWTISWLDKKNIRFKGRTIVTILGYYLLILIPLFYSGIIMNPVYALCSCGLDKLLLGIIVGSFSFWFGASWHYYLKEKNQGKVYFPFQKVVMPIIPLIVLSVIFYSLTK